ncbi:MAG TPA: ATP-binding protein [Terriglobia bacterium]|nr:ATP-binding protein [Terriglobia bacterium]
MRAWSLRRRMMLMFCAVVGVLLAGCFGGFYVLLSREVHAQLDRQLLEAARPVISDLKTDPADEDDVNQLDLPGEYFALLDSSGHILQRSKNLQARVIPPGAIRWESSRTAFHTLADGGRGRLRLAVIPFRRGNREVLLAVAAPTSEADRILETFRGIVLILLPLSLLVTALVSTWYVGKSLTPIATFTRHAERMTEQASNSNPQDLWQPLPVKTPRDELGRLAETFNRLFDRVASALGQLRQFASDASHELRTPLSVLRGETELLLSEPRQPEEYQEALRVIDSELKKLSRIVEGLFTLSMADAGQLRLACDPLYVNEVLEAACVLLTPLAQAKNIAIERDLRRDYPYLGDEVFLRQLFMIFLENAVKYSPPNTSIKVDLEDGDGTMRVRFEDQGTGIPPEHQAHIFDRFYRVEQPGCSEARPGEIPSGGLGLAIAYAIARAMGGSIDCRSELGAGSTFAVNLPLHR